MTQAQPHRIGVVARLRYRFDTAMSRGTGIVILWLGGITFGLGSSAVPAASPSWY